MHVLARRAAGLVAGPLLAVVAPAAAAAPSDLDPGFGAGGTAVSPFTQGASLATGGALDPQGRLVAVGSRPNSLRTHDRVVPRDTADGQADGTFGTGGRAALSHARTIHATVTVTSRDKAGNRRVVTRKMTLRRGKRRS